MLIEREPLTQKKLQFRIRMSVKAHDELMQYCQWAGISYRDFFIQQACEYIFANDIEWITYKQGQAKIPGISASEEPQSAKDFKDEVSKE